LAYGNKTWDMKYPALPTVSLRGFTLLDLKGARKSPSVTRIKRNQTDKSANPTFLLLISMFLSKMFTIFPRMLLSTP
jgi:hypothetical protein